MYNALQVRYWNLKLRFPLYFWGEGETQQLIAIKTLILVVGPFRWQYLGKDRLGLLVSYVLYLLTVYCYAFLLSTPRFVSTNPIFHINLAIHLTSG